MKYRLFTRVSSTKNDTFYNVDNIGPFRVESCENTSDSLQKDIQFIKTGDIVTREDILKLALKHINSHEVNDHWLINALLTYISQYKSPYMSYMPKFYKFYISEMK